MLRGSSSRTTLPSSWQPCRTQKLRKRAIQISWPFRSNNIRRSASWKAIEKQLNLPTHAVKLGNGESRQCEVVGQEDQPLGGLRIFEPDPTQGCFETFARVE